MKDAYSAHADWDGIDEFYPHVYQAYVNIFERCGLKTIVVQADSGIMGGNTSHEFMAVSAQGEDTLITCTGCDYAGNAETGDVRETGCTERGGTRDRRSRYARLQDHRRRRTVPWAQPRTTHSRVVFYVTGGEVAVRDDPRRPRSERV